MIDKTKNKQFLVLKFPLLFWTYLVLITNNFSSVPDWDSDVGEDGELVYIKVKPPSFSVVDDKAPLLENCETFQLRNNFKRSSTRRSTKGKTILVTLALA